MRASRVRQVLTLPLFTLCSTVSLSSFHGIHEIRTFPFQNYETTADSGFAAEFRGPGTHHRYDDSPDDYDMDMDQRTRFLGGRSGRIILLGDGTEISVGNIPDDDGDVDMEDRGEAEEAEEDDLQEQVQKDAAATDSIPNGETDRSKREETPAPAGSQADRDSKSEEKVEEAKEQESTSLSEPNEPKMAAASDSLDSKTVAERTETK